MFRINGELRGDEFFLCLITDPFKILVEFCPVTGVVIIDDGVDVGVFDDAVCCAYGEIILPPFVLLLLFKADDIDV